MNCDRCQTQLSAWLDDELVDRERELVVQHVESCATCRQVLDELRHVDMRLGSLTLPPDAISQAQSAVAAIPARDESRHGVWRRRIPWVIAAIAASVLFAMAQFNTNDPPAPPARATVIARLVRSTGELEAFDPATQQWRSISVGDTGSFSAGTRLRTLPGAVCEVETADQTTLRLDSSAEVVLLAPSHVEVVEGQIWGCVSSDQSLRVDATRPTDADNLERSVVTLSCPSHAEWQWAGNKTESVFQSLADESCQLTLDTFQCPVGAKEKVSIDSSLAVQREAANVQSAKLWQIPLLAIDQGDTELGGVLETLLIQIGNTKAGFMQEQQVRRLGPAGALPLLAYVQSEQSQKNPSARLHAMRIASETADRTALDRLQRLQNDENSVIADYASSAVKRIESAESLSPRTQ